MTHPVRRRRATLMFAALAVVSLGACGSDSAADNGDSSTGSDSTTHAEAPANTSDYPGPSATVSADIPGDLDGQIGALDVDGDPLPMFAGDIDDDPAIGMDAPVLLGTDFDGKPVRVDAAADGPTMLVYLAHWCPHCNAEVPVINAIRDAGDFPDDLNIVGVSTAPSPDRPNFPPSQWFKEVNWAYPVIVDGVDLQAGTYVGTTAYGLDGFPFVTLIAADGSVAARWSGEAGADDIVERISTYLEL